MADVSLCNRVIAHVDFNLLGEIKEPKSNVDIIIAFFEQYQSDDDLIEIDAVEVINESEPFSLASIPINRLRVAGVTNIAIDFDRYSDKSNKTNPMYLLKSDLVDLLVDFNVERYMDLQSLLQTAMQRCQTKIMSAVNHINRDFGFNERRYAARAMHVLMDEVEVVEFDMPITVSVAAYSSDDRSVGSMSQVTMLPGVRRYQLPL